MGCVAETATFSREFTATPSETIRREYASAPICPKLMLRYLPEVVFTKKRLSDNGSREANWAGQFEAMIFISTSRPPAAWDSQPHSENGSTEALCRRREYFSTEGEPLKMEESFPTPE